MSKSRGNRAGRRVQAGRAANPASHSDPVAERIAAALCPDARALLVKHWREFADSTLEQINRWGGDTDAPEWLTFDRPAEDAAAIIDRLAIEGFYQPFTDGFEHHGLYSLVAGRLGGGEAAHTLIAVAGVAAGMILGLDHRDGEPVPERDLPAAWVVLLDAIAIAAWEGRFGQVDPRAVLEGVEDDNGRNPALALLFTEGLERVTGVFADAILLPDYAAAWPRQRDHMTVIEVPDPDGGYYVEDVVDESAWLAAVEAQRQAWRAEAGYLLSTAGGVA